MASFQTRILLTGFEAFLGETMNPSQEIVLHLAAKLQCDGLILPVSFERSADLLRRHLLNNSYDYILMLGQAGKRSKISLERTAVNLIKTSVADEDGAHPVEQKIVAEGPEAIRSSLPLEEWLSQLQKKQWPVEISDSAGEFVCNHLYYQIQTDIQQRKVSAKPLFIHVPYLPAQALSKPEGTASMDLETMVLVIEELIQIISRG